MTSPPFGRTVSTSTLDLRYRSAGSFLMAYATRLSRGELFVETPRPWPLGTRVELRLHPPAGTPPLELAAVVAWTRPSAVGPGQPCGMGLGLASPIDAHGAAVDTVASLFMGTRILLGAADPTSRAVISRYLKSMVTCEIVEADFFGANHDASLDLAIVDLDSTGEAGQALVRSLKEDPRTAEVPLIALAQSEHDRSLAGELGADEVLPNPPPFTDVHAAVVHALARPIVVGDL
jgi:uncharacterized protein (TIGR02266 family)